MDKKEQDTRKRGNSLGENKVKKEIIEYILRKDAPVPGPEIIKKIKRECNLVDEKNIRSHLKGLHDKKCIELTPHKPGLDNKWNIQKLETLQNIRKFYPNIELNTYEKSLNIVLDENVRKRYLLGVDSTHAREFRVQLSLSISFFDMCLENDITTLYDRFEEIYEHREGRAYTEYIKNQTKELYTKYIKKISVSFNIWLAVYDNYINDSMKLEFCRNSLELIPNIELPEEKFLNIFDGIKVIAIEAAEASEWETKFVEEFSIKMAHLISQKMLNGTPLEPKETSEESVNKASRYILKKMLEEIPLLKKEIPAEEYKFLYVEELSTKMSYEIFEKMFLEIPAEVLKTPDEMLEVWVEILKKILQEILEKMLEAPDDMYHKIYEIRLFWAVRKKSVDRTMFEHYFHRDIADGTVSSDEREYMLMMESLRAKDSKDWKETDNAIDKFYKGYIKKCREKTGVDRNI
jgi:hypothetical protein